MESCVRDAALEFIHFAGTFGVFTHTTRRYECDRQATSGHHQRQSNIHHFPLKSGDDDDDALLNYDYEHLFAGLSHDSNLAFVHILM